MSNEISSNFTTPSTEQVSKLIKTDKLNDDEKVLVPESVDDIIKEDAAILEETPDAEDVDTSEIDSKKIFETLVHMGSTIEEADLNNDGKISEEELEVFRNVEKIFEQTKQQIKELKNNFTEKNLPQEIKDKVAGLQRGAIASGIAGTAAGIVLAIFLGPLGLLLSAAGIAGTAAMGLQANKIEEDAMKEMKKEMEEQIKNLIKENFGEYENHPYVEAHRKIFKYI